MVIAIFGESCVGKTTLADAIKDELSARVYTGRDYLRLRKNADYAKEAFIKLLSDSVNGDNIIYVISEKSQLELLPEAALRILMTADIETIKSRFAPRCGGTLPLPVARMLERKHGEWDEVPCHMHVTEHSDFTEILKEIKEHIK